MTPQPATATPTPDVPERVRHAAAAAHARKAVDLKVLHLAEVSDFTDFFLLMSGTSERHVKALAKAIDEALRPRKVRPLHTEGDRQAHWVLMDYGDFVVHIFLDDIRHFYGLERLWGDAPDVTEQVDTEQVDTSPLDPEQPGD